MAVLRLGRRSGGASLARADSDSERDYRRRALTRRRCSSLPLKGRRMTRTQLVQALARKHGLDDGGIRAAVNAVLETLSLALARGQRVELRGFGSFVLRRRPSRVSRNPKTGYAVHVPAKHVPHFKVGKELRSRVNQGTSPRRPAVGPRPVRQPIARVRSA